MQPKDGYYAALERQRAGENSVRSRFEQEKRGGSGELDALEVLYTDVGMRAFTAFNNCLDWLSHLGSRSSESGISPDELETRVRNAVVPLVKQVQESLDEVHERMARLEGNIAALEAGMRRIDKFTLEAFRNIQEIEERIDRSSDRAGLAGDAPPLHGRLAKEDAAHLALEAGRRMKAEGRRLTLASVAREAGLKYGQIVYAFGNKDGFLQALEGHAGHGRDFEDHASA